MFNFTNNTVNFNGKDHDLDSVREYLLSTQHTLCMNHFVKSILKNGKRVLTYDWDSIIRTSIEAGYLNEYK